MGSGLEYDASFEAFYRQHHSYIYHLCKRRFRRHTEIEELVSLVWLDIYKSEVHKSLHSPRTALYNLVQWRATDLYRKRRRRQELTQDLRIEEDSLFHLMEEQEGSTLSLETQLSLKQLLDKESPLNQGLLVGRYVEGLSWSELAARYDVHRNTAFNRVQDSLARLQAHFLHENEETATS